MIRLFLWAYLSVMVAIAAYGQPSNDDCLRAIFLPDTEAFCSPVEAFTSVDATPSGLAAAACFNGAQNDVWFSFVNAAPAVTINIIGNTPSPGGTLEQPQVEIYRTTDCVNFLPVGAGLACEAATQNNVQLNWSGMSIGELIYIRVQSGSGRDGTFQLCIDNFFPPADPGSDCNMGAVLCDKSSFIVESVTSAGLDRNENVGTCLDVFGDSEDQSTWFQWTARTSGSLEFTLTPLLTTDDLDFVLYEIPNGLSDCSDKIELRCNAAFTGFGGDRCGIATGIRSGEPEVSEPAGCRSNGQNADNNGFVDAVNITAGSSYALVINNFTQSGSGFRIDWGGTSEFEGPVPDFELIALDGFECDKRINVNDLSFSDVDDIVSWSWNFGQGAIPQTITGAGPHEIEYVSFGRKTVVLTVESSEGCLISNAQTIDIASCCADFSAISIDTLATGDVTCFGEADGFIEVQGMGGTPPYQYRLDDDIFLPINRFEGLDAGQYTVTVTDIKGCEDQITVLINQPPQLILQLDEDQEIDLGTSKIINSFFSPGNRPVNISWSPADDLSCSDCFFPLATPRNTTTFRATITDSTGCTAVDSITLRVVAQRSVYIPNAFTPGSLDALNTFFSVYGGIDVAPQGLVELKVFNRWGGLVYNGENIPFGHESNDFGWDGTVNGELQPTGVYSYLARVRFLDDVEILYTGDVTLIR